MTDYGYLRGNSADDRGVGCKKGVGVGGIGPDKSEGGGVGNKRGGGGILDGGIIRGSSRELIHGTTQHLNYQ